MSYQAFSKALTDVLFQIRDRLQEEEIISTMRFDIEVRGRVHEGELRIEFVLGQEYASINARGGNLEAVIEEFIHRELFNRKHKPLMINHIKTIEPPQPQHVVTGLGNPTDDIPF